MIENLLDPAHLPFAHENTIGKAIAKDNKIEMKVTYSSNSNKNEIGNCFFFLRRI